MALLGLFIEVAKIVAYPEILQLFNDEICLVRISLRKSLIKVAIYEIYGMKWEGTGHPNLRLGAMSPWTPLATPMNRSVFQAEVKY